MEQEARKNEKSNNPNSDAVGKSKLYFCLTSSVYNRLEAVNFIWNRSLDCFIKISKETVAIVKNLLKVSTPKLKDKNPDNRTTLDYIFYLVLLT